MRNFFLFIRQYTNLLYFLFLEMLSLLLISRTDHLQGNTIANSSQRIAGKVYKTEQDVLNYFHLKRINDSLLAENARLQERITNFQQTKDTLPDYQVTLTLSKPDTLNKIQYAEYRYRTARVINNSIAATNNFITLNRGAQLGLKKNMGVISGSGVVGKVVEVNKNYAVVLSILSEIQPISAQLKNGFVGTVKWDHTKPNILQMRNVPQEHRVKIGDTVSTSRFSFFPGGVMIGRVIKVFISKSSGQKVLYIKPATDFDRVSYVYVIENTKMFEQSRFEDSVKSSMIK